MRYETLADKRKLPIRVDTPFGVLTCVLDVDHKKVLEYVTRSMEAGALVPLGSLSPGVIALAFEKRLEEAGRLAAEDIVPIKRQSRGRPKGTFKNRPSEDLFKIAKAIREAKADGALVTKIMIAEWAFEHLENPLEKLRTTLERMGMYWDDETDEIKFSGN